MASEAFHVEPIARFAEANAGIRRPKEIACFSYDENHQLRLDDSSLRYYYPPTLPADLSSGFDTFQELDDAADDHIDSLLVTIAAWERANGRKCETDIISWRGMMTKIMAAPFEKLNGFEMNATCFQGTIYIEENHAYKLAERFEQNSRKPNPGAQPQAMMSYWGYKFETLSLIPQPWDATPRSFIDGRGEQIVNNSAQYCSVARTGYGKVKMVIGGEVDAVWDKKPDDKAASINWVELKTAAEIYEDRDMLKFERKLMKYWIQSFLLGVPKIIVGFRTANGLLVRLEELETQSIPERVKIQGRRSWDGNVCINFAASFLEWLQTVIKSDGVWRIRKRERVPKIEVVKLEDTGHGDIISEAFLQWRTVELPAMQDGGMPSQGK